MGSPNEGQSSSLPLMLITSRMVTDDNNKNLVKTSMYEKRREMSVRRIEAEKRLFFSLWSTGLGTCEVERSLGA